MAATGDDAFAKGIAAGLDRAYADEATEEIELDVDEARLIVFSDHHKGARDGADDFLRAERAYHAALGHYLEKGHVLHVLGDVEELWENPPAPVIGAYPATLELEAEFHRAGRYMRYFGNHDDLWRHEDAVAKWLRPIYPNVRVREALKLRITRAGEDLGLVFLAHGHQGTADSDRFAFFSRFVVRYIWRPLQRHVGFASNTPATDWDLRQRHEAAMFGWARGHRDRPVLITGHTHRPIFSSSKPSRPARRPESEVAAELDAARRATPPDPDALAALHAELELIRAEARRYPTPPIAIEPPCYFNSGCCSFGDGDITGIEIADGEIRLVRWLDDDETPKPKLLASDRLEDVLGAVRGA
jgi:hypothetical protein